MKRTGKKASEILGQVILWVILIGALFIFSIPFLFMITNSFEEFSYVLPYPPKLFPEKLDFSAYRHILQLEIFPTAVKNSVINTCVTVAAAGLVSTLSAYGFARIKFPGREKIFNIYLFTLMVPGFLNIIPQFLILKAIPFPGMSNGLVGTRAGLILVFVATNVCGNTFFLRNFFRSRAGCSGGRAGAAPGLGRHLRLGRHTAGFRGGTGRAAGQLLCPLRPSPPGICTGCPKILRLPCALRGLAV